MDSEVIEVPKSGGLVIQYVLRYTRHLGMLCDCTITFKLGLHTAFAHGQGYEHHVGRATTHRVGAADIRREARLRAFEQFQKQIAHPATTREEAARALVAIDAWLEFNGGDF